MMKRFAKYLAMTMAALMLLPGAMALGASQNGSLQAIVAAAATSQGVGALADQLAAPERYTASAANASGTITLTADASLSIPGVNAIPVLGVEKAPITQAQVDALIRQLVKGELCSAEAYVPSKAQLLHKLDLYQKLLEGDFDDPLDHLRKGKSPAQVIEGEMAQLSVQMDSAGDAPRLMPIQGQLSGFHRPYRYAEGTAQVSQYETGEELNALAYSESVGYETLLINNSDTITNFVIYAREPEDFAQNMGDYSAITEDSDLSGAAPMTLSQEQAKQTAQALMDALGIEYMDLSRAEKAFGGDSRNFMYGGVGLNPYRQVWLLRYTRTVEGVPTTYTDFECMKVEAGNQADPIMYESMTFAIDDSGIVGFQWSSPYAVTGTETSNAKLLSFAECASVFETMVFPVNEWMAEGGTASIHVKQAKLGLSRVTERDVRDKGLLIPVWDFIGDVTISYENGGQPQQNELTDWTLLTVNAITGDVIDRNLGY